MPRTAAASSAAGDPFPGDVAKDEAELAGGQIDVVEEVAADGAARNRRRRGGEKRSNAIRLRQQRLLNGRRDLELLLEFRLLECLAVEPRVFDRQRRLGD